MRPTPKEEEEEESCFVMKAQSTSTKSVFVAVNAQCVFDSDYCPVANDASHSVPTGY